MMSVEATLVAMADVPPADPADRLATLFDAHHGRLYRLARRKGQTNEPTIDLGETVVVGTSRTRDGADKALVAR